MKRYTVTILAVLASITAAQADQVLKGRPGADTVTVWSDRDGPERQSKMPLIWRDDVACVVPAGTIIDRLPLPSNRTLNDSYKPVPVVVVGGACHGFVELKDLRLNG